jgi:membrane protease YdiL (CAAX protease family)
VEDKKIHIDSEYSNEQEPTPWGFWATVGFFCIIAVVYVLCSTILGVVYTLVNMTQNPQLNVEEFAGSLESNGFFLSISICVSAPLVIGLTVLFAKIRKKITVKQYLNFHKTSWKQFCKWSLVLLLFLVCSDKLTLFLGRPTVPNFMVKAYTTAYFTPLFWLAVVVVAPLVEEISIRGFLFKGIEHSKIGPLGAVLITSLIWAILHVQYDAYGIASIFTGGLLLGCARLNSKSIWVPVTMHVLMNIIATIQAVIYLR